MKKLIIMFPGQGSQYMGMAKSIWQKFDSVKQIFNKAGDILHINMQKLCFESPDTELKNTDIAQPLLVAVNMAYYQAFTDMFTVKPAMSAGHSLGEISALICAGALSFETGLKMAKLRGKLMQETSIPHDGAFHTPLMKEAAERWEEYLNSCEISAFKWPVIANADALPYESTDIISRKLVQQLTGPVLWDRTILHAEKNNIELAIEVGPRQVLKKTVNNISEKIKPFSFDLDADVGELIKIFRIKNTQKKTDLLNTIVAKCLLHAVCTRNLNWDNDEYEKGVIIPVRQLKRKQEEIEKDKRMPAVEEMKEAVEYLKIIFRTKKVPVIEQKERFTEIFEITKTGHLFKDFKIEELKQTSEIKESVTI